MALVYIEQLEHMSVDEMQETHENEIKLLNAIEKLAIQYERDKTDPEELEQKLDEYIEHVKKHFTNEERLMQEHDFPSYDMHKTAHDMFLWDLDPARQQWKQFGNIKKIINFIYKVPEWILIHVNTVDAATANYLTRKMG